MKTRPHALSITHYAVIVAALTLCLLIAFGILTYREIQQVQVELAASSLTAAQQELDTKIEQVFEQTRQIARKFATRDEVRQQLKAPHYYPYWRQHRILHADVLPPQVIDADVYNSEGKVLASGGERSLPETINHLLDAPLISFDDGEPSIIEISPIWSHGGDDVAAGHVAIRARFLPMLAAGDFRFIDSASIRFPPESEQPIPQSMTASAIRFELRDNPMSTSFETILRNAILRLGVVIGLITLLIYPAMVYVIGKPLCAISNQIDHLKRNPRALDTSQVDTTFPIAEIEKIRNSLMEYHQRLANVNTSLSKKNEELSRLAQHDALTGVLNRRAFDEHWRDMSKVLGDHRFGVCMILFDVVHFKALNDSYGHQIGDEVLKAVAGCIQGVLRRGEHLFRLGGDEFATLLIDCESEEVHQIADRCQRAIAAYPFDLAGLKEPIRVSIGLSHAPTAAPNVLQSLHWQADIAMHYAKKPGRTNTAAFRQEMAAGVEGVFSNRINNAIYEAIINGTGLKMSYQPVVDLRDDSVAYFEALLRIDYEDEQIMPSNILPVVEARRLETELDRAVIKCIRNDIEAGRIPRGSGLSINVSGPTISSPDVVGWLMDLKPYLKTHRFILEITETALITQLGLATETLRHLRYDGFQVALDDFGSGYSSVRYLASMPVDIVKFDISLIRLLNSPSQRSIVLHLASMIIESGHGLVAEGIETERLLDHIRDAGFTHGQGYLFGRPDVRLRNYVYSGRNTQSAS